MQLFACLLHLCVAFHIAGTQRLYTPGVTLKKFSNGEKLSNMAKRKVTYFHKTFYLQVKLCFRVMHAILCSGNRNASDRGTLCELTLAEMAS